MIQRSPHDWGYQADERATRGTQLWFDQAEPRSTDLVRSSANGLGQTSRSRLIIRVHGGLSRVVRPGTVVRTQVLVGQSHDFSAMTDEQSLTRVIVKTGSSQIGHDLTAPRSAVGKLEVLQVEIRHEEPVVGQPGGGTGDQPELVANVMEPVDAGDQVEITIRTPGPQRGFHEPQVR